MRGREGTKAPPRPVRRVQEGPSDAPTSSLSCRRALASWVWTLPPGPPLTFLAFRLLPRPFVPHQQQLLQPGTDFDPVTFGSQGHIRKWLHLKPGGAEATPGQTSPSAPSSEAGEGRVASGRRSSRERTRRPGSALRPAAWPVPASGCTSVKWVTSPPPSQRGCVGETKCTSEHSAGTRLGQPAAAPGPPSE